MIELGIVDPTKVTRSAIQNAASVAAMSSPPRASSRTRRKRTRSPRLPRRHGRHVLIPRNPGTPKAPAHRAGAFLCACGTGRCEKFQKSLDRLCNSIIMKTTKPDTRRKP